MSENTEKTAVTAETADVSAAAVQQEPAAAPRKAKKVRKPRSVPMKILMGIVAFVLCVAMFAVTLAGTVILDLRVIVSRDGISEILDQVFLSAPEVQTSRPAMLPLMATVGGSVESVENGESTESLSAALVDWAYDQIKSEFGDEVPVTKAQVQDFVEKSTVKDFLADKVAGMVEDFYAGESKTAITKEEVKQLIRENAALIEENFGVAITEEDLGYVDRILEESGVLKYIEENGLADFLEKSMSDAETMGGGSAAESIALLRQILDGVRTLTSNTALAVIGGILLLLIVLLFFVTGRSIPATLADTGIVLTLAGLILSAPCMLCLGNPGLWQALWNDATVAGISTLLLRMIAGVNYTVLGVGVAMIVAAIAAKIVKSVRANKA